MVGLFASVIFRTSNGTLVFDHLHENAVVTSDGNTITVEWPEGQGKGHARALIPAGKHYVKVAMNGVEVTGRAVTVESGKETWFKVNYGAPTADPGPVGAQDKGARSVSTDRGDYVSLFNGRDIAGWSAWGEQEPLTAGEANQIWQVRDGVLHGSGAVSHLYSPRGEFKDFRVRAEVKINDRGNSGLYFRVAKSAGFPSGYEAQINSTGKDPNKTGSLYRTSAPAYTVNPSPVPPDTWFTLEAQAIGDHIRVWVDGKQTAESQIATLPYTSGQIAIEVHSPESHVQVRKLEVMELNAANGKSALVATDSVRSTNVTKDSGKLLVPGPSLDSLAPLSPALEGKLKSLSGETHTSIQLENHTSREVQVYWLDYQGNREERGKIPPGGRFTHGTFATHPFLLTDSRGTGLAIFVARPREGIGILGGDKGSTAPVFAGTPTDLLQPGTVWVGERTYRKGAYGGITVTYEVYIDDARWEQVSRV